MKIYVIYDQTGKIRGTAASYVDGARIGFDPRLSCLEEEIEVEPDDIKKHLRDVHETCKVNTASKPHIRIPKAPDEV